MLQEKAGQVIFRAVAAGSGPLFQTQGMGIGTGWKQGIGNLQQGGDPMLVRIVFGKVQGKVAFVGASLLAIRIATDVEIASKLAPTVLKNLTI